MSVGLVAYGSSDESDNDDISPPGTDEIFIPNVLKNSLKNSTVILKQDSATTVNFNRSANPYTLENDDKDEYSEVNALSSLPPPKLKLHELDIDVKKLKSSGTVKISIPSLSQLDSEDSEPPLKKKLKPSQKGSGLFALLPNPKRQGLVPQSVGNKIPTPSTTSKANTQLKPRTLINTAPKAATKQIKTPLLTEYDDSGDEEDTADKDFFSLENNDVLPVIPVPDLEKQSVEVVEEDNNAALKFNNEMQSTGWSRIKTPAESANSYFQPTSSYPNTQEFMSLATEDLELNEEALQQLCGRRDRNKMQGNMQLIDVSGDEIMPDSREWLTKQLTEETNSIVQSHKKKDGPTSQQRRKHQITYLAFQAKEHELELKNQWANNRVSRKQTQAKYGF